MKPKHQVGFFICIAVLISASWYLYEWNYGHHAKDEISIQTSEDFYVSADLFKDCILLANRTQIKEWEKFHLVNTGPGRVAIIGANSKFVGLPIEPPFAVRATYDQLSDKCEFNLKKAEEGYFLESVENGKYLSRTPDGLLIASEITTLNAEKFQFNPIEQASPRILYDHQITLLSIGLFLTVISILTFQLIPDKKLAVFLLFAGSLLVRLFMVELAHYLHWWDEQYHALVAKNMIEHPFIPMLFDHPTIWYDPYSWVSGHVWLHKQPLFLWQMALSMKLFGINTLALRLPSAIMLALVVPMTFRMGKIGFNESVGYFAALLFALSNFSIMLSGGAVHTDHNDAAFLFYVTASIWAWFEYENSSFRNKKYWIFLIGLFSGCAVLVKWLTGILIFSGWGMTLLLTKSKRTVLRNYLHLSAAFLVALIVFIPWQIYVATSFPEIWSHESAMVSSHFFDSVEGHGEPFWFHFSQMKSLYGLHWIAIVGCFLLFLYSAKKSPYKIALATIILVTYYFFSFAVTKMVAFTFCISPLVFIVLGVVLNMLFSVVVINPDIVKRKLYQVIFATTVLTVLSFWNLNLDDILNRFSFRKVESSEYGRERLVKTRLIQQFPNYLNNPEKSVIFNCKSEDAVPILFFTEILDAHTSIPDEQTCNRLIEEGYEIAVLDDGQLPDHIMSNTEVVKIRNEYFN